MCGQAEGAARRWAGPPSPHPTSHTPAGRSPDTAPAAHGETPPTGAGTATPGTPRGPLTWTLLGEGEAPSAWRGAWWPPDHGQVSKSTGCLECPRLPEHCLLNHSSGRSTAEGGSGGGGAWGGTEGAAVGAPAGQGLNPSSAPTGCVIWGNNLTSLGLCFHL